MQDISSTASGPYPVLPTVIVLQVRDQVQRALQSALQGQQQTVQRLEQDIQAAEAKAAKQPDSVRNQSMSVPCHLHGVIGVAGVLRMQRMSRLF